jgi:hypothetical protein
MVGFGIIAVEAPCSGTRALLKRARWILGKGVVRLGRWTELAAAAVRRCSLAGCSQVGRHCSGHSQR